MFDFLFGAITEAFNSILPRQVRVAICVISVLLLAGLLAWLAMR